jgi:hypothetical protein
MRNFQINSHFLDPDQGCNLEKESFVEVNKNITSTKDMHADYLYYYRHASKTYFKWFDYGITFLATQQNKQMDNLIEVYSQLKYLTGQISVNFYITLLLAVTMAGFHKNLYLYPIRIRED